MLPELRELRYVIAVAEEGSLSAAAARLHVSQQSVSAAIRLLEARLGAILFFRRARGVELTHAGQIFVDGAKATLANAAQTVARTREAAPGGRLRIGYAPLAAAELTTPLITELRSRRPGLAVQLRLADYDDPTAGLATDEVDIALLRRPVEGDLAFENLFAEQRVVVLPLNHPAAGREQVRIEDIERETIIRDPGSNAAWSAFWMGSDVRQEPPPRTITVTSFDDELVAVALGQAIAITSAAAARLHPRSDIAYVPLVAPPCVVAVAWSRTRPPNLLRDIVAAARLTRSRASRNGVFAQHGWTAAPDTPDHDGVGTGRLDT